MSKHAHTYNEEVSGIKNGNSKHMLSVSASSWNKLFLVDSFLDNILAWGLWAVSFKIKINFYVDFSTVNFSLLQLKTGTRFEVCFLHGYIFPNNGQCRVLSITILGGWCLVSQGLMLRRPLIIFLRCHHYNIFCYTNNLPCIILNDVFRFTDGTGNEANFFGIWCG